MATSPTRSRTGTVGCAHEGRAFPWLELALAISVLALLFQLFPSVWWGVVSLTALIFSYVDVRNWAWRSYAVVCVFVIAALIVVKSRQDNA